MPQPPLSKALAEEAVKAVDSELAHGARPVGKGGQGPGAIERASEALKINHKTLRNRLAVAKRNYGIEPQWDIGREVSIPELPHRATILRLLKKGAQSLASIASSTGLTRGQVLDTLDHLKAATAVFELPNGFWSLSGAGEAAYTKGTSLVYKSDDEGLYRFGVVSDTHLGSKYERLDVLNDLYDRFAKVGIERVFHAGNWIEGESSFNKYDLLVTSLDGQIRYLAENYPRRPGIVTYAVAGDDHEGWYAQRDGIDVGKYAEAEMRRQGRDDWVNMGYMEAHITLEHKKSGKTAVMALVHPGGGSAYALSYSVQKIIESLEGGEKPAVAIYGHYHKLWAGNIRNVWAYSAGTTKDQDPFMRKKRIEAHIGGGIIDLEQDAASGAIISFGPKITRYFNRGFYGDRWSHSGPVTLPERSP